MSGKDNMSEQQKEALKKSLQSFITQLSIQQAAEKQHQEQEKQDFKFWKTQPVPSLDEDVKEDGPIEADTPYDQIQKDPYPLPSTFTWCNVNIDDKNELNELYTLLTENYVEDDDALFRFDYSADFLKWALQPPGWKPQWFVGVRVKSNNKLVAFISAIPATLRIHKQ